jgi:hypothetical protein
MYRVRETEREIKRERMQWCRSGYEQNHVATQ